MCKSFCHLFLCHTLSSMMRHGADGRPRQSGSRNEKNMPRLPLTLFLLVLVNIFCCDCYRFVCPTPFGQNIPN